MYVANSLCWISAGSSDGAINWITSVLLYLTSLYHLCLSQLRRWAPRVKVASLGTSTIYTTFYWPKSVTISANIQVWQKEPPSLKVKSSLCQLLGKEILGAHFWELLQSSLWPQKFMFLSCIEYIPYLPTPPKVSSYHGKGISAKSEISLSKVGIVVDSAPKCVVPCVQLLRCGLSSARTCELKK